MESITKKKNRAPKNKQKKIDLIEYYFKKILTTLELDLEDENFAKTPERIAKMYVNEIFSGLNQDNIPKLTTFKNDQGYDQFVLSKNITLYSYCAHHFVPFFGKAHIAYYPKNKIIGLSKLNRIVDFYSKKPQTQENLTKEIALSLVQVLETKDVGVLVEADHLCVSSRGIYDTNSSTTTSYYSGKFDKKSVRKEFLESLKL